MHGCLEVVPWGKEKLGEVMRGSKTQTPRPLEVSGSAGSSAWQAALSHAAPQPWQRFSSCLPSPGQTLGFQQENGRRARSKVVGL